MKALALLPLLSCLALAADPVKTNARLPDDKIIFPPAETAPYEKVTAILKSDTVISQIVQGNWISVEHLVTYEVTKPAAGFSHKELTFVCRDRIATKESGIMEKRVPWPFRKRTMSFAVIRDQSVRHEAYFNIFGYDPVEPQK